jgi:hypothetical protein
MWMKTHTSHKIAVSRNNSFLNLSCWLTVVMARLGFTAGVLGPASSPVEISGGGLVGGVSCKDGSEDTWEDVRSRSGVGYAWLLHCVSYCLRPGD